MAYSDKNIVIVPSVNSSTIDPQIIFTGGNQTSSGTIAAIIYPDDNGTLSFEGSVGQLLSITNNMTGTIFSVNDISGIPSIEVLDTGEIRLAEFSGNVGIGTGNPISQVEINTANSGAEGATLSLVNPTTSGIDSYVSLYLVPNNGGGHDLLRAASIKSYQDYAGNFADLRFYTAAASTPTQRMRIKSNGKVGIGTDDPSFTLDVTGTVSITSGVIQVPLGSASVPTYTFSGDTNTGIFSPGTDTISFSVGGVEKYRLNTDGGLGASGGWGGLYCGISGGQSYFRLTNNVATGHSAVLVAAGTGALTHNMALVRYNSDDNGPIFTMSRSNTTTVGTHALVDANDTLGNLVFEGSDGLVFRQGAKIYANAALNPTTGSVPGRLYFCTTSNGLGSASDRMNIDEYGCVTIGGSIVGSNGSILTYTLTNVGSLYTDGTYTNNVLSGSISGVYATFTIVVVSGSISSIQLTQGGYNFAINETISIPALGGTGSGGIITVNTVYTSNLSIYDTVPNLRFSCIDSTLGANQTIGEIVFASNDSTANAAGIIGSISVKAIGTSAGTYISFNTANVASSPIEAMRINGDNVISVRNDGAFATTSSTGSYNTYPVHGTLLASTYYTTGSTGAIVFTIPYGATSNLMYSIRVQGMLYSSSILDFIVQGYKSTSSSWAQLFKTNYGSIDIQVRFGVTPSGQSCLILGDIGSTWVHTHIGIPSCMICYGTLSISALAGWTSSLVTDLTGYTVSSTITPSNIITNITASSIGSGSTPSYTFTGDTNTGMFSPGADLLSFTTGGTERMRIGNGVVAIASTTTLGGASGSQVRIGGNTTGATSSRSVYITPTVQSDVTDAAYLLEIDGSTAAAAFTLSTLRYFMVSQGTIGASSSITSQIGYSVSSNFTGATNNYGFYSSIASGTGRFNFYAGGTADNFFAGKVGIGSAPGTGYVLRVQKELGGDGTTSFAGIIVNGTIESDVTSNATYFKSISNIAADFFTVADLCHYSATQGLFDTGSAATNQYGFFVDSTLVGAFNNYGFYSNIPNSANRYNFYANGTAPNYFAGDIRFNKTITSTGTTGAQTINKTAGSVNFAAAASSLVVTNSLVSTTSVIIATVATNDTTMKSVSAVAAAGSFTLYANAAATAETRVNFIIIN